MKRVSYLASSYKIYSPRRHDAEICVRVIKRFIFRYSASCFSKSDVLKSVLMKITIFWDVTLCRLLVTDVSEKCTATF